MITAFANSFKMWFGGVFLWQTLALLSVFMNTFMYGCATSWVSNAMVFLTKGADHRPYIPIEQYGMLAQIFEVGRLFFAIPGGMLMDRFGRKKILIAVGTLNLAAWVLLSISVSSNLIYLSRFILGVAAALLYVSSLTTIGEIASPQYRGTLASINEISNMSGQLFESIITVATGSYKALTYSTLAAASAFIPTLCWLLETPHHLVNQSNYKKAKENLAKIRPNMNEKELAGEFDDITQGIEDEKSKKQNINWFNFFKIRVIRKAFRCGLVLNVLSVSCGGPVLSLYITAIVPANPYFSSSFYPLISFLIQFLAAITSTIFIDWWPRRTLYLAAALVSIGMQTFGAAASYLHSNYPSDLWRWSLILNCFLYLVVDRGLISPLNSTVRSEIFPQSVKGIGNALCVICQAITLIVFYQVYAIVHQHLGLSFNFLLFAVNSAVLAAVVYFWLPETRGKSLADVQLALENDTKERSAA